MLDEKTVYDILAPVREYVATELGVSADWHYLVDEDYDGIRGIIIRLDVVENRAFNRKSLDAIDSGIWDALRNNHLTQAYFPHVIYNAVRHVSA